MLFSDEALLSANKNGALQRHVTSFDKASSEFSVDKTNVMCDNTDKIPQISIGAHTIVVLDNFTSLSKSLTNRNRINVSEWLPLQ